MLIAGFQKLSMLDYPGMPAAVVFTPYCNMNCWYCHNEHIIGKEASLMEEDDVLSYLEKRRGMLKAVVISGGEPTLQQGLVPFIETVRGMGYSVKLDTNGMRPDIVKDLLKKGHLDYVAMDIKGPLEKYAQVTRVSADTAAIRKTILYLINSGIPHEFRTTFAPDLTKEDILSAAELIAGTDAYYLQQYRKRTDEDPEPHSPSYVRETADAVRNKIGVCTVRGI